MEGVTSAKAQCRIAKPNGLFSVLKLLALWPGGPGGPAPAWFSCLPDMGTPWVCPCPLPPSTLSPLLATLTAPSEE